MYRNCGAYGAHWVVIMGNRRPEDRHDIVADMLVDHAAIALDDRIHSLEIAIEESVGFLCAERAREARIASKVGEQNGDLAAFAGRDRRQYLAPVRAAFTGQFFDGFEQPLAIG